MSEQSPPTASPPEEAPANDDEVDAASVPLETINEEQQQQDDSNVNKQDEGADAGMAMEVDEPESDSVESESVWQLNLLG